MHPSQELIFEDAKEVRFKLFVKPTFDFMMEILSYGPDVEILEPAYVREELKDKLNKTLTKYK